MTRDLGSCGWTIAPEPVERQKKKPKTRAFGVCILHLRVRLSNACCEVRDVLLPFATVTVRKHVIHVNWQIVKCRKQQVAFVYNRK